MMMFNMFDRTVDKESYQRHEQMASRKVLFLKSSTTQLRESLRFQVKNTSTFDPHRSFKFIHRFLCLYVESFKSYN